jgi:hypothetical protein
MFDAEHAPEPRTWIPSDVASSHDAWYSQQGVVTDHTIVESDSGSLEPSGVQRYTDTDDHHFSLDGRAVSQGDTNHSLDTVNNDCLEFRNTGRQSQVHTVLDVNLCADRAHLGTKDSFQWKRECFDKRDLETALATTRCDFTTDEAGTDDNHSRRVCIEFRPQRQAVGQGTHDMDAGNSFGVRQSAGSGATGNHERIERDAF